MRRLALAAVSALLFVSGCGGGETNAESVSQDVSASAYAEPTPSYDSYDSYGDGDGGLSTSPGAYGSSDYTYDWSSDYYGDTETGAPNDPALCDDLEGCFDNEGMYTFLQVVTGMVDEFLADTYVTPPSLNYLFVAQGDYVASGCTDYYGTPTYADEYSFFYCSIDGASGTIYIGQSQFWVYYNDGDAAAAVGVAHEMGHSLQNAFGIDGSVFYMEQQADCVAGSWLGYVGSQGQMSEDDIDDIGSLLVAIGDVEPGGDHGTSSQRAEAFAAGANGGMFACNQYTLNPIIS